MNYRSIPTTFGVALLLGALAALFLLADFRAARSSSSTQSEVAKYTMGIPQGAKAEPIRALGLYVDGDDQLALALERELVRGLASRLGLPRVTLLGALPEQADQPVLVVQMPERDVKWTPVYARAAVTAHIAYASDGDMAWRDQFTVVMKNLDGQPQVRVRGDLAVSDTTEGMISAPSYRRHLAQQIATSVAEALQKQLAE